MRHDIQEEIFTKTKFWGKILTQDVVCLFIIFQIGTALQQRIYRPFSNLALIFVMGIGIFWLLPSFGNYHLKNYHRIYFILTNNKRTYHPIERIDFHVEEHLDMVMGTEEETMQEDLLMKEGEKEIGD